MRWPRCSGGHVGRRTSEGAGDTPASTKGFTIVEVLVVMAIILVLAGLVLGTSSYVHNKAARSRAEAEIAAMSAALENYKADNGVYPSDSSSTDILDARTATPNFPSYQASSAILYQGLSGDTNGDGLPDSSAKSYMPFKSNQIGDSGKATTYLKDPFGNSYGYSTAGQAASASGKAQVIGYNPTFDLWSTAGSTNGTGQAGWVKNW
ncbi:MAG: type II secretion system protein GspG [Chthoniobacterales bacterium]